MPEIKLDQLILFSLFILPGAISMYVYGLLVPQKELKLQEKILESICFSLLNILIVGIPLRELLGVDAFSATAVGSLSWRGWSYIIAAFVILPITYPFLLRYMLRGAEQFGIVTIQAKTAWDDFFGSRSRGCWVQVLLNDGQWIGGRFDRSSYASSFPDPGHILIEELWEVDEGGRFTTPLDGSPGAILRPTDYKWIRVFPGNRR